MSVKIVAFTLLLDGMPWLPMQYAALSNVTCDLEWFIVHGAAMNNGSTAWCNWQPPRLSNDGSMDFLRSVLPQAPFKSTIAEKEAWESKDAMVNEVTINLKEPCILFELDVDELYHPEQISRIVALFESEAVGAIRIPCRYWVGEKLVCEGENCWSNWPTEYERAWRWEPGMKMLTHEPPKPNRYLGRIVERDEAKLYNLGFDHKAYVTEAQVRFKERYYNYTGLLDQWKALQRNQDWPVPLSRFFAHVRGELPLVNRV